MGSSEIECQNLGVTKNDEDIYAVCASGDLQTLKTLIEKHGEKYSVSQPDDNDYYPLQWAALNNHVHVALYILQHGGDVNAKGQGNQTALHWAGVRGSVEMAEFLLENGAKLEAEDVNCYRPIHIAAQYGQTSFMYHIIKKWNADFNVADNGGRTPLHWAAYKGFTDCIRLLLFMDANQYLQDKEGCTPLHWAAMRGNLDVCTLLVQAGTKEELKVKDIRGFTPAEIAADRGQHNVASFLLNVQKKLNKQWDENSFPGRVFKSGYAPILLFIMIFLTVTFMRSVITSPTFIKVTATVGLWAWMSVFLSTVGLFMFYRCSRKDPGYIPINSLEIQNSNDEDVTNKSMLHIDLSKSSQWAGYWSQLCPACKIIRPVRSKHCSSCKRCVEQFDHHCPWISNCVGKKNKWDFFVFVCLETSATLIAAAVAIQRLWTDPFAPSTFNKWLHYVFVHHPGVLLFLFIDTFAFSVAVTLTGMQSSLIARNITTNEMANSSRYSYLRDPDGQFQNPYDYGFRKNCTNFFIHGYNDDIVESEKPLQENGV